MNDLIDVESIKNLGGSGRLIKRMETAGVTINSAVALMILFGYMVAAGSWSWRAFFISIVVVMIINPAIAFMAEKVMRSLQKNLEAVLDGPEVVNEENLSAARQELLNIPSNQGILSVTIWIVIVPPLLHLVLTATASTTQTIGELYVAVLALFPLIYTLNIVGVEYKLRKFVAALFPYGGLERFQTRNRLTVRQRMLINLLLIGPYSIGLFAFLVYVRVSSSATIPEALERLSSLELFLCAIGVALAACVAFDLSKSVDKPLRQLLTALRSDSRAATVLPLGSADDFGLATERLNERKLAESVLKASEARVRAVIESMPIGVTTCRADSQIESVNPALEEMLGCCAAELVGKSLENFLLIEKGSSSSGNVIESLLNDSASKPVRMTARREGGSELPVELSARKFDNPEIELFLIVIEDISAREALEKMKAEFVDMISHDLRTPLTSARAFLSLVSSGFYGDLPPKLLDKTVKTERDIDRLITLVNKLLDVEKMEAGKLTCFKEDVHEKDIIESSINSVRSLAEQNTVAITYDASSGDVISADRDQLIQVFVNLLSNAIKFSSHDSSITVAAANVAGGREFRVIDEGRGIPHSHLDKIFNRFEQVQKGDASEKKGTGLGLSICKAIIEAHGGSIGVESTEGAGSTFWFCIPAASRSVDSEPVLARSDALHE